MTKSIGTKRRKILWIDCETTGLDPVANDIWQLAYLIDINGKIEETADLKIRPYNIQNYSLKALEMARIKPEDLEALDYNIVDATFDVKETWGKYIDKYDKEDKFVVAGYNVKFDREFLYEMFKKAGDKYGLGSWCFWPALDVSSWVAQHIYKFKLRLPNYKLKTVCKYYNIELEAHDALSDITATRELYYLLEGLV